MKERLLQNGFSWLLISAAVAFVSAPMLALLLASVTPGDFLGSHSFPLTVAHYVETFHEASFISSIETLAAVLSLVFPISVVLIGTSVFGVRRLSLTLKALLMTVLSVPLLLPQVSQALGYSLLFSDLNSDGLISLSIAICPIVASTLFYLYIPSVWGRGEKELTAAKLIKGDGFFTNSKVAWILLRPMIGTAFLISLFTVADDVVFSMFLSSREHSLPGRVLWDLFLFDGRSESAAQAIVISCGMAMFALAVVRTIQPRNQSK